MLDVATETEDGKPVIWLWCKSEDSGNYVVKQRYRPSFYIHPTNITAAESTLKSLGIDYVGAERRLRGSPVKVLRIYAEVEDLEDHARKLLRKIGDAEPYEEDLRLSAKYLLDQDLRPCSWLNVKGVLSEEDGIKFVEAESVERLEPAPPPNLLVMTFNPIYFAERGSPRAERDPVRLISILFSDGENHQLEGSEDRILREFVKLVNERDPDIIVGFGSNRIHWKYLSERASRLGLRFDVGRLGAEPRTSVYGHVSLRGRINIDLEEMARDIPELTVETLEEFVSYLGIEQEFDVVEEYELAEQWRENPEQVKRYSMQRAEALLKAYEALRDFIFSLSELTGMPADYILTASTGFRVENYLMHLAVKVGELIPKRKEIGHVTYPGGLVKTPKPGLHTNVAVVDFRSMYPSLMIKYNISFDTLSDEGENIAPNGYRFKASPEGFLPHALKTLLKERRSIQERLRMLPRDSVEARVLDARQRAVKIITNAIYGYTGWIGARWYSREVAEATTAWGREVINSSIEKAQELGMTVIYSDTDSLFLKNFENKIDKLMNWIEKDLELEAKVEKIFSRIIFTEAKKKYAGLTKEGRIEITGLEAVRGDWSMAAREAQREVIEVLLRTGSLSEALRKAREHVRKLMRKETPLKKLIIWRQITRPLDEYSATQPHIVVARRLIEEGWRIQPGDKVGYIITSGSGPLYRRVKPYFEVKPEEVDWSYYIDKQVAAACARVLAPLGVKVEQIKSLAGEASLTDFF